MCRAFLRHDDGRAPGCELLVGVPRAQLMLHVEAPLCSPSRAPRSRAWQLEAAWTRLRAEQWFQPLSVAAATFPPQPGTRRMTVGMGYPARRRRAAPWPCSVDLPPPLMAPGRPGRTAFSNGQCRPVGLFRNKCLNVTGSEIRCRFQICSYFISVTTASCNKIGASGLSSEAISTIFGD